MTKQNTSDLILAESVIFINKLTKLAYKWLYKILTFHLSVDFVMLHNELFWKSQVLLMKSSCAPLTAEED